MIRDSRFAILYSRCLVSDRTRVLVIDDDRGHAEASGESLERAGFQCALAFSGGDGLQKLESSEYDVVLTDLVMGDVSGIDILRRAKARQAETEVIVMTGYPSYETAAEALEAGACDYIEKPVNLAVLRAKMKKAVEKQRLVRSNVELRRQLDKRYGFEGIVGGSAAMQRVFDTARQVSPSNASVLVLGESGTGKELVARAIHQNSPRRGHRFVALNCAALPESMLESELFGHIKGAFTGATYDRKGHFEYASGGTLFLDEIGDLPPATQIKLLRVIESREIIRVGTNEPVKVDVRLISATNRDLASLVKEGRFREDLYFRLRVVTIELPPLRERLEDLPLLSQHFVREFAEANRKSIASIAPEAMQLLYRYRWPGNVRELRNCIEQMVALARGETLGIDIVPDYVRAQPSGDDDGGLSGVGEVNLENAERELIRQALAMTGGNRERAAAMLGIGERTLYRKIKRYGLQ